MSNFNKLIQNLCKSEFPVLKPSQVKIQIMQAFRFNLKENTIRKEKSVIAT